MGFMWSMLHKQGKTAKLNICKTYEDSKTFCRVQKAKHKHVILRQWPWQWAIVIAASSANMCRNTQQAPTFGSTWTFNFLILSPKIC